MCQELFIYADVIAVYLSDNDESMAVTGLRHGLHGLDRLIKIILQFCK